MMQLRTFDREPLDRVIRAAFRRNAWVWGTEVQPRVGTLPEWLLHWRPLNEGRTIAQILNHIGSATQYYIFGLHEGQYPWPEPLFEYKPFYVPAEEYVRHPLPYYQERLNHVYATYMETLLDLSDSDLDRVCTMPDPTHTAIVEWIIFQVPGHTNYHMGQINYMLGRADAAIRTIRTVMPGETGNPGAPPHPMHRSGHSKTNRSMLGLGSD